MIGFRDFFLLLENEGRLKKLKEKYPQIDHTWDGMMWNHINNRLEGVYPGKDRMVLNQISIVERTPHLIDTLAHNFDPTPNKAYTDWLIRQYKNKGFRFEDHQTVRDDLENFERLKQHIPDPKLRDINNKRYDHISKVADAVAPFLKTKSKRQLDAEALERIRKTEVKVVHNQNGLRVEELLTKEASCALHGHDTRWCTSAKKNNQFDYYNRMGPLYVVYTPDKRKYQFHFESGQFMDEGDRAVSAQHLADTHPELRNVKVFKGDTENHLPFLTEPERDKLLDRWAETANENKVFHVAVSGKPHHHTKLMKGLGRNLFHYPLVAKELAIHTDDKDILQKVAKYSSREAGDIARYRLQKMHPMWDFDKGALPSQKYELYPNKPGSKEHLTDIKEAHEHHRFQLKYAAMSHNRLGENRRFIHDSDMRDWHQEKIAELEKEFHEHFPDIAAAMTKNGKNVFHLEDYGVPTLQDLHREIRGKK